MAEPDSRVCPPPGKLNTISLTRETPLPQGEARLGAKMGAWVERRGGSQSAQGARDLLCPGCALSTCHLLQATPCYKSVWALFLAVLLLPSPWGAGWSQHLGQTLKTGILRISCYPLQHFQCICIWTNGKILHPWIRAVKQCSQTSQPASN